MNPRTKGLRIIGYVRVSTRPATTSVTPGYGKAANELSVLPDA